MGVIWQQKHPNHPIVGGLFNFEPFQNDFQRQHRMCFKSSLSSWRVTIKRWSRQVLVDRKKLIELMKQRCSSNGSPFEEVTKKNDTVIGTRYVSNWWGGDDIISGSRKQLESASCFETQAPNLSKSIEIEKSQFFSWSIPPHSAN